MNEITCSKVKKLLGGEIHPNLVATFERVEQLAVAMGGTDELPVGTIAVIVEMYRAPKPEVQPEVDYTSFLKSELVEMCESRGLDGKGNKDDLIARIVNNDKKG